MSEYSDGVAQQVKHLIETHTVLVASEADVAARKVRYALMNYMDTVYAQMASIDGGRKGRKTEIVEDPAQMDIESAIAEQEDEDHEPAIPESPEDDLPY